MIYPVRLGLTLGLIWAAIVLILSLVNKTKYPGSRYAMVFYDSVSSIYPGCNSPLVAGKAICAGMAFADLFTLGLLIGLLYKAINIKY